MWFVHDGAPAHFSHVVQDILNITHYNQWIGREGQTVWPPSLPDLNPLGSTCGGHLKAFVYLAHIHNVKTLHQHTINACHTIVIYPGISKRV
jgi:hypothetical protein